jgi:N-acylneuraminate cytidylyltransferase/CMP-N,N'-diacetyllegionaminic acid synthase
MSEILGIITTRGGSRGIHNTYTFNLAGTPVIAYALREADKAKHLPRIILSTDSKEVARAAGLYSTKTIVRPDDFAGEAVSRTEIVRHALEELEDSENSHPDTLVILPASCPLRRAQQIDQAVEKMEKTGADSVVSVCLAEESPYRMVTLKDDRAVPFAADAEGITNESELPRVYRLNNAIYVLKTSLLQEQDRLYGGDVRAIVMKQEDSVEITDRYSFMKAEAIVKERKKDIFK